MAQQADNPTQRLSRFERRRARETDATAERADKALVRHNRTSKRNDLLERIRRHNARAMSGKVFEAAAEQLARAVRRTKLTDKKRTIAIAAYRGNRNYIHGLAALAAQHRRWLRTPGSWSCRSHNARRQFASLARHLLCEYSPPECMDAAWFNPHNLLNKREQDWFIWIGRGNNLRKKSDLPVELTRRAVHLLNDAPVSLTVTEALRWAQLRAMGANKRLTDELLGSDVGHDFENDAFWITVARFFIDQPMLDAAQVRPIIDYIADQRFAPQARVWDGERWVEPGAAQPNFTMRGRTLRSLIRQVNAWHRGLGRGFAFDPKLSWSGCGLKPFDRQEGESPDARFWHVRELTSARELAGEGHAMRHCVATYTSSCHRGATSIFSMTCRRNGIEQRVVTIEVHRSTRRVVQVRGKYNALPDGAAERMLRIWAAESKFTIVRC